jgi:glyoxylase-like metal-dependent hydrolase (beta-lactamase superfamily II)
MDTNKKTTPNRPRLRVILTRIFAGLAVVVLASYYILFVFNGLGSRSYSVDIEQVRTLANDQKGQKPVMLEYESLLPSKAPLTFSVAGGSLKSVTSSLISYKITYDSPAESIVVDTAFDESLGLGKAQKDDQDAHDRIALSVVKSKYIIPTHEHADHFGGILKNEFGSDILNKSLINREQFNNESQLLPLTWPVGSRNAFKPLDYTNYYAVSPGVVLIKAAGHTSGSQMVFVQLQNGKELLLVGDVSWRNEGIQTGKAHPYFASIGLGEDRGFTLGQVKSLRALSSAEPNISFLAGHDADNLHILEAKGVIKHKFSN